MSIKEMDGVFIETGFLHTIKPKFIDRVDGTRWQIEFVVAAEPCTGESTYQTEKECKDAIRELIAPKWEDQ